MAVQTRRTAALLGMIAWLASTGTCAGDSPDQVTIRQLLTSTFAKAASRLQVEPVVVVGDHAIAGWIQGERGGRALLGRHHGTWRIAACSGDGLKDPKVLIDADVPAAEAGALARGVVEAEAPFTVQQRAKFSSFDGWMRVDRGETHPPASVPPH
ncbi:copper uptake system-associated protein [Zoogloea sp.]|uniref:copper uptake system-associated protein n=1 Tax=Zoogloea sp. TaxID=49181 RepID=UPI00262E4FA1|nr:copper uptake system-associated protein [Zoogloea sp.]MDD3354022.1 copper uptake system-associated protein [Zoogloea sp.]